MNQAARIVAVATLSVGFCSPALAQGLVIQKNLSLSIARTIADGALEECKKQGFNTAVAVLDRAGQVLVLMRDEAASPVTLEMARRKPTRRRCSGAARSTGRSGPRIRRSHRSAISRTFWRSVEGYRSWSGTMRSARLRAPALHRKETMRARERASPRSLTCSNKLRAMARELLDD